MKPAVAALLGALLAGCTTAGPIEPDASIDPRGRWTVAAVNGRPTGGGPHFRFEITPPTGDAQFGCNAGGGSLSAGNGWVVAGNWIITAAGCRTRQIARFERLGFDIAASGMAVERRGDGIRLRNERGSIDLVPAPAFSIAGRWQVVAVNGRPVAGAADFKVPGFSIGFGCNDGRGAYRQDGDRLIIVGPFGTTERGCMSLDGGPAESVRDEDEGFRIAARPMRIDWYGPNRARLSNEAGTIDLSR